jgi:hypothetical protein
VKDSWGAGDLHAVVDDASCDAPRRLHTEMHFASAPRSPTTVLLLLIKQPELAKRPGHRWRDVDDPVDVGGVGFYGAIRFESTSMVSIVCGGHGFADHRARRAGRREHGRRPRAASGIGWRHARQTSKSTMSTPPQAALMR